MKNDIVKEYEKLEFAMATHDEQLIKQAVQDWRALPKPTNPAKANATQIGGDHYKGKAVQPWDFIAANELDYFQGNIVKYVTRWRDKSGIQDLRKALHYLEKYIELNEVK